MIKPCYLLALAGLVCHTPLTEKTTELTKLFACGDDRVIMLETDYSSGKVDTIWQWKASETKGLPAEYMPLLTTMDECKPIEDGGELLLSASSGAVMVLERDTKKALFYARAPNAHSIEALPGGRIVAALSTAPKGNRIALYDRNRPEEVLYSDSLYSGHGVVWMPETKRLYAVGYDELRAYTLEDWNTRKPRLKLAKKWKLPDIGGHDLSRVSAGKLLLTTHENVWTFDLGQGIFTVFEPLKGMHNIKSVHYDEATHRLVYTKGEISWWTHNIYFQHPNRVLKVPQINMYKVRVMQED